MPRLSSLSRSIKGKVAIVTGAASGMGRATAQLFADEGAHVAVTDLDLTKVQVVVDEIVAAGGSAHGWKLDVTNAADRQTTVSQVSSRWGGIDILVNNVATQPEAPCHEHSLEDFLLAINVNLTSYFLFSKLCLPATPSSASRPRKRDVTACVGGRALRAVKKDADRRGVRVCDHALRRAWVSLRRVRPCALCHPAPTGCLSQPPERARVPRDPRVSCACVQSAPRGSRRPRRPRRPDGRLCSHARRRHAGCCST